MKKRNDRRRDCESLCGELHADDGVDPRDAFTRIEKSNDSRHHRKSRQLCKQVHRAIATALAGELGNPVFQALEVVAVEPAPDDSRLQIVIALSSHQVGERQLIRAALTRASGMLRALVAQSITRKRMPELTFSFEQAPSANFDEEFGSRE